MELDVWDNKLVELNVNKCSKLEQVRCQNNLIRELDFSNCTKLIYLDCSNNQITNLNISNCKNLNFLSCFKNKISKIEIGKKSIMNGISKDELWYSGKKLYPVQAYYNADKECQINCDVDVKIVFLDE